MFVMYFLGILPLGIKLIGGMKIILGKKIGMTRIFDKEGNFLPVTLVEAGPCIVTQLKSQERDGYQAVQIGFGEDKKMNKPKTGHLKKSGGRCKWLREFRTDQDKRKTAKSDSGEESSNTDALKVGDKITVDVFKPGDIVQVRGISKGKGFAGVIKRHGFSRGPETHGSDHHRAPGSIGSMYPQRVFKGKKMPGRMGGDYVTVKGLEVVEVKAEKNLLAVKGAVPGPRGSLLEIKADNRK